MTYPWASGEVLTAADLNAYAGLILVKTHTVSATPGQTSTTVTNAFSSTFRNYMITFDSIVCSSTDNAWYVRLDNHTSSTYYHGGVYANYSTGTVGSGIKASASNLGMAVGGTSSLSSGSFTLFNPNIAAIKQSEAHIITDLNGGVLVSQDRTATARTGFTMYPSSGTFYDGTIRVYGFNNG